MSENAEKRGGGKARGPFRLNSRYVRSIRRRIDKKRAWLKSIPFGTCARCGEQFIPDWNEALSKFSSFCGTCCVRNLGDALGIKSEVEKWLKERTL